MLLLPTLLALTKDLIGDSLRRWSGIDQRTSRGLHKIYERPIWNASSLSSTLYRVRNYEHAARLGPARKQITVKRHPWLLSLNRVKACSFRIGHHCEQSSRRPLPLFEKGQHLFALLFGIGLSAP